VALVVETAFACHLLNLKRALHRRADFDFLWMGQRRWWWRRGDSRRHFIGHTTLKRCKVREISAIQRQILYLRNSNKLLNVQACEAQGSNALGHVGPFSCWWCANGA